MFNQILIGEKVEIRYGNFCFKGTIVDEKKNILIIKKNSSKKKIIKIIKKPTIIKIGNKTIQGKAILKRFEDRIK